MLGPPGSGKGTQAPELAKELGVPHIATGDLLREAVKNKTELGEQTKGFLDRGELVPNELVVGLINDQLTALNAHGGFILDGFPRNKEQADALAATTEIDLALLVDVPKEDVIKRLSARRVCEENGHVFNLEFKPPKNEGVCDVCGGRLIQRTDDTAEVVEKRYEVQYNEQAVPLIESYRQAGLLLEVDGRGPIEEVFERIMDTIRSKVEA